MRIGMRHALLFGIMAAGVIGTLAVQAQQTHLPAAGETELSLTYTASHSNFVPGDNFWMQGGDVELVMHVPAGFAGVASISGGHAGPGVDGVPLSLVSTVFGPRYTWVFRGKKRDVSLFGQGLVGITQGFGSMFPTAGGVVTSTSGLAIQTGGGIDVGLSPHWAVRAGEVQWLRTELPNATTNVQNVLKVGAGIVFRFKPVK